MPPSSRHHALRIRHWALALTALGTAGFSTNSARWRAPETPARRAHHELVYHAGESKVYLVGGSTRADAGYHYFDDVWTWNGAAWIPQAPLPFPRSSHRIAYDSSRRLLVLFGGGFGHAVRGEGVLWEKRNGGWKAIGGDHRAALAEPGLCYDQLRERLVVFGGFDQGGTSRGETWEWNGHRLDRMDSTGPRPRVGHAFLFDPVRNRCLLFGGRGTEGWLTDTWTWNGTEWQRLEVAGPSARWFFGSATDRGNARIVLFGGRGPGAGRDSTADLGDTWSWDGMHWTRLAVQGPSPRSMAKMAFSGQGVLLFGGRQEWPAGFEDHNDTWELQDSVWVQR